MTPFVTTLLEKALDSRAPFLDPATDKKHESAYRLYNGFYEGDPELIVDIYAKTALIQNYAQKPEDGRGKIELIAAWLTEKMPWLQSVVVKERQAVEVERRNGMILMGNTASKRLRENGLRYAFDLQLNRDAGFYLDTRSVRRWAKKELQAQAVLNCFAYTGSLGVAALGGGAKRVVQTDLNKRFLNVAKESYTLNGFKIDKRDFLTGDFFSIVNRLKKSGDRFDTIFIDPPFFTQTGKGEIDLNRDTGRLINKVRPIVTNGGRIVMINNAIFLSGSAFIADLEVLCRDGYMEIETLIPIDADVTGYSETIERGPVADQAPFNHTTKVAVLRVKHKSRA